MGKFLGPFDLSVLVLVMCGFWVSKNWVENFGEDDEDETLDENKNEVKELRNYDKGDGHEDIVRCSPSLEVELPSVTAVDTCGLAVG